MRTKKGSAVYASRGSPSIQLTVGGVWCEAPYVLDPKEGRRRRPSSALVGKPVPVVMVNSMCLGNYDPRAGGPGLLVCTFPASW